MKRKTARKARLSFLFFFLILPLLVWLTIQKTNLLSKAAPSPSFGQAADISIDKSTIYAPPILPIDVFTIEGWVKLKKFDTDITQSRTIFMQGSYGSGVNTSLVVTGNKNFSNGESGWVGLYYWDSTGAKQVFTPQTVFSTEQWHHIALVRNGATISVFLDGALLSSTPYSGTTQYYNSQGLSLGAYLTSPATDPYASPNDVLYGQLDEVRVSSIARYSSSFTPPDSPFVPDSSTLALYHFDGNVSDATTNAYDAKIIGQVLFFPHATPTPTPFIKVLQPNGGETLTVGETYKIRWDGVKYFDYINILLFDNGATGYYIAKNIPPLTSSYDWTVSTSSFTGNRFRIEVDGKLGPSLTYTDSSDNYFTILYPTPTPNPDNYCPGPNGSRCEYTVCTPCTGRLCPKNPCRERIGVCRDNICRPK